MKLSTAAAFSLALALSACSPGADGKESGMMTALRAVFAFKACTSKLESQFKLGPINSVSSDDMDPVSTGKPGEWDVKFTASVTEKDSGRVTRYRGVCHVRRDRPHDAGGRVAGRDQAGDQRRRGAAHKLLIPLSAGVELSCYSRDISPEDLRQDTRRLRALPRARRPLPRDIGDLTFE